MKIVLTVFEKFESFMKSRKKKRHDCISSRKFFPTPKHPVRAIGISGVECNSSSTCVLHDVEHVADHVDIFSEHEEGTHTQVAEVLEVLAVLGFGGIVALKVYNTHSTQMNNSGQTKGKKWYTQIIIRKYKKQTRQEPLWSMPCLKLKIFQNKHRTFLRKISQECRKHSKQTFRVRKTLV